MKNLNTTRILLNSGWTTSLIIKKNNNNLVNPNDFSPHSDNILCLAAAAGGGRVDSLQGDTVRSIAADLSAAVAEVLGLALLWQTHLQDEMAPSDFLQSPKLLSVWPFSTVWLPPSCSFTEIRHRKIRKQIRSNSLHPPNFKGSLSVSTKIEPSVLMN